MLIEGPDSILKTKNKDWSQGTFSSKGGKHTGKWNGMPRALVIRE